MISDFQVQDILTSIYADYDLVSEPEKDKVNLLDDKLCSFGSISPAEMKFLKKLLKEIKKRAKG